jgi:hypothetical protein
MVSHGRLAALIDGAEHAEHILRADVARQEIVHED